MRAALVTAPGTVELVTLPDPAPGPGEVVLEVAAVGLCGTDLHLLAGHVGTLPVVLGHEFTGTVVAVGRGVSRLAVGDRVAVDPNLPCRACRACHAGRGNLCPDLGALGITTAGGAAELVAAPQECCVALSLGVDLRDAALIEPLSCAVRGFDVLRAQLGASVLVYGAGTMGLMLLALAGRAGAVRVDVVDLDQERLRTAARLGCSATASSAAELDRPQGWDVVIDATGNTAAISDGLRRVASGGTFLQFGVASPTARVELSPYDVYRREISVVGSMAVLHSFERAAELFAAGVLDPAVFITDRVPLTGLAAALTAFGQGCGVKTQVLPAAGALPMATARQW